MGGVEEERRLGKGKNMGRGKREECRCVVRRSEEEGGGRELGRSVGVCKEDEGWGRLREERRGKMGLHVHCHVCYLVYIYIGISN